MQTKPGEIIIEEKQDHVIMHLDGSFNSQEHDEELRETFRKLVKEGKNRILVDFQNVFYFNSTAIRGLLSGRAIVNKANGNIVFYNLNQYVDNIFRITNLHMTFSICADTEEAVRVLLETNLE